MPWRRANWLAYYEANGKAYDPHDAFSWTALLIALILGIGGGFLDPARYSHQHHE